LHDKIVQTAVKQAKYPRYYRLLADRIRLKETKAATEQLFPPRINNFKLMVDDLFKPIIAMLFGPAPSRRRINALPVRFRPREQRFAATDIFQSGFSERREPRYASGSAFSAAVD
jgi:hypothetical protein